jgi:hypothetical protein
MADETILEKKEIQPAEIVTEEKEETVPLSVFLKQKTEAKTLKKRLAEVESSKYDADIENQKTSLEQKLAENGIDENLKAVLSEQFANIRKELKSVKVPQDDFDDEIDDLTKNEMTSDAKTYKDAIVAKYKELKAKGADIDMETAYYMVRSPRLRMKEIIEEKEQKQALKRQEVETKPSTPQSAPSSPKSPYPLDEDDKKALKGLQYAQPNAGWTEERYFKIMKG